MNNLFKATTGDRAESHNVLYVKLRRVFIGEEGIRLCWSILIFAGKGRRED